MDIQRKNEYDFEHKELIGAGSGGNRVYKIQHVHTKKVITLTILTLTHVVVLRFKENTTNHTELKGVS